MVKIKKFKTVKRPNSAIKRFRGHKTLIKTKKDKAKKKEDKDKIIYKPENRSFVLVGLFDLFEQVDEQISLPKKFIFSVIALFDNFLNKSKKFLSRREMVRDLYACLDILDKEQNLKIFSAPFFKKFYNYKLECKILETVNLEIYPEKICDYFDKFYYQFIQNQSQNTKIILYLNKFKKYFYNYSFFLLFHNESNKKKTITNYISCFIFTLEMTRDIMPIPFELNIIENYLNDIINNYEYKKTDYIVSKILIDESIKEFNSIYQKLKCK